MNLSVFRTQKNGGQSMETVECKSLIVSIIENTAEKIVTTGRDIFQALSKSESRKACNEIPACGRQVESTKIWLERQFGGSKRAWRDCLKGQNGRGETKNSPKSEGTAYYNDDENEDCFHTLFRASECLFSGF